MCHSSIIFVNLSTHLKWAAPHHHMPIFFAHSSFSVEFQLSGSITYNGHRLNEFVPQTTAAYVSQQDSHTGELTVRETLEFAARCQGVGFKYGNVCICPLHVCLCMS